MSFEIDSWINRSLIREHKKKRKDIYFVDKIQKFEFTFALCYKLQKVHFTHCYTCLNFRLFYFILILIVIFLYFLKFFEIYLFCLSSSHFVKMIAFNVFSLESYYTHNFTLSIDECKKMIRIARLDWPQDWISDMSNSSTRFNSRIEQKFLSDESDRILAIVRRSNSTQEIVQNLRLDKIR